MGKALFLCLWFCPKHWNFTPVHYFWSQASGSVTRVTIFGESGSTRVRRGFTIRLKRLKGQPTWIFFIWFFCSHR